MMITRNELLVAYGTDAKAMTRALLERAELAGRIPAGAQIGLKPNLAVMKPADTGSTTHVELVAALIEYLQEHGHINLTVLEGSGVGDETAQAYRIGGYEALSRRYGVPLVDTKRDKYEKRSYGGIEMEISRRALEMDFLINLPVLKGHCQTRVTGALKNLKGCLSDREKRRFHTLGLHKPIAYLNKILKPGFILVDGLCGDPDFEEGGNPVRMDRIYCALDPVLADSYQARCLGYEPYDIGYIRLAEEIDVGSSDLSQARIVELNPELAPAPPLASRKARRLANYIREKDACSLCYANLMQALSRLDEEGKLAWFLHNPVSIGQGWRGEFCAEPGVGDCTGGARQGLGGCPPAAADMYRYLSRWIEQKRAIQP